MAVGEELLRVALAPEIAALRRLVIAEGAHHPELQPMWNEGAPEAAVRRLSEFFAACTRDGKLAVDDPRTAAEQFVTLVAGAGVQRTAYGIRELPPEQARKIASDAATLIVRAFRVHDG